MKRFIKKAWKSFLKEEDGDELVQWGVIIALAAALIVIAYEINSIIQEKLHAAQEQIELLP